MKIALASKEFINGDFSHNYNTMISSMKEAAEKGADLICFGETFLQGFDSLFWSYEKDREIAVSQTDSIIKKLCRDSREIGIDVAFGYVERDKEVLYSSCLVIQSGEILYNYRRISRGWKEYSKTDEHYREGEKPSLFSYKGKRVLIALCGDLWDFPEQFQMGEDFLLWPVYVDFPIKEWEQEMIGEYAAQASSAAAHTLLVNSICKPDAFGGCFAFENGRVACALMPGKEGLLFVDL